MKKAQLLSTFLVVGLLKACENSGLKRPVGGHLAYSLKKTPKMQHRCFRNNQSTTFFAILTSVFTYWGNGMIKVVALPLFFHEMTNFAISPSQE